MVSRIQYGFVCAVCYTNAKGVADFIAEHTDCVDNPAIGSIDGTEHICH